MRCSGISDEAGDSVEVQIKAHQEIGWEYMELRLVDGENVALVPEAKFEEVYAAVTEAGMKVSCFAGTIGNWSKKISGDFRPDVDELKQAIPRMQRCGTRYMRIMTWPNDPDAPWPEDEWKRESLRRVKELAKMAEDGDIVLAIENCRGWAGLTPENALQFIDEVGSPALKWLYDTGNVVGHGQDPWDFYSKIKPQIAYVHIKDSGREGPDGPMRTVYCGEGEAMVREVIEDLLVTGYEGFVSIEPHLAAVVHTGESSDPETMYSTYVEYGRRLNEIVAAARKKVGEPGGRA